MAISSSCTLAWSSRNAQLDANCLVVKRDDDEDDDMDDAMDSGNKRGMRSTFQYGEHTCCTRNVYEPALTVAKVGVFYQKWVRQQLVGCHSVFRFLNAQEGASTSTHTN